MRQLVTSEDIERLFYPTRRDAQELLSYLIRRLIMVSASDTELSFLNMAAGDDIRTHGWDGIIEHSGQCAFVPGGWSVWEMGVSESPKEKANRDYSHRVTSLGSIDPKSTTFVFVTSRVWVDRQAWSDDRKKDAIWKDVRVIDATVIATWLERFPPIATWVCTELGRPIDGLQVVESAWRKRVAVVYGDAITPGLIVGGREVEAMQFEAWLRDPKASIDITAETAEEALLFVLAVLRRLAQGINSTIDDRVLVISSTMPVAHLATMSGEQLGVLADPELAREYQAYSLPNLTLIVPRQEETRSRNVSPVIRLGGMRRAAVEESLIALGFAREKAYVLARETKGSLQALLLIIAEPERRTLNWASGKAAADLAPLVLAGRWTEANHPDHAVVAALAARPYADVERMLAEWSGPGQPLQRRGGSWDWRARRFAWGRLASALKESTLEAFYTVAQEVLVEKDPGRFLPNDHGVMGNTYGTNRTYSTHLREGLVGSLVFAALNTKLLPGNAQARVAYLVRDLLATDDAATHWRSLESHLPDLAEAAPDAFLDAVSQLVSNAIAVRTLFQDDGIFSNCSHAGLLWALERLAWSSDYLGRTVQLLARLAALDPGGKWSNRPDRTLATLFDVWHPATWAPAEERIAAMRLLFKANAAVAWTCAITILRGNQQVCDPFARPVWRPWSEGREEGTSAADVGAFLEGLVDLLLDHAQSTDHWEQLVPQLPRLLRVHEALGKRILQALLDFDAQAASDKALQQVHQVIQLVLSNYRSNIDKTAGFDSHHLDAIELARARFRPRIARFRHAVLFTWLPERSYVANTSWADYQKAVEGERRNAIAEVLQEEGLDGVLRWAVEVSRPDVLGHCLAAVGIAEPDQLRLMETGFNCPAESTRTSPIARMALGYSAYRWRSDGAAWQEWAIRSVAALASPESLALFAESAEPTSELWEFLASISPSAAAAYWRHVSLVKLDCPKSYEEAIDRLLDAGRIFAAVDLCGMMLHSAKEESHKAKYDSADVCEVLARVLDAPLPQASEAELPAAGVAYSGYVLDESLSYLEEKGAPRARIARWELKWLFAIQDERRGPKALSWEIATDASLFMDLMMHGFRPAGCRGEPCIDQDKQASARASLALKVLAAWRHVPGLLADAHPFDDKAVEDGLGPITPAVVGTVDPQVLAGWIAEARRLAEKNDRVEVTDAYIGQILAYSPADSDGLWPCSPVRMCIESTASTDLEHGLFSAVLNRRGLHCVGRDGVQEARLASQFRIWSESVRIEQPRVGRVLRELAEHYDRESKDEAERGRVEEFDE